MLVNLWPTFGAPTRNEGPVMTKIPNNPRKISTYICKCINRLVYLQEGIDNGFLPKSPPGRGRKNPYKTSRQLKKLIRSYFNEKFEYLGRNSKLKGRKDLLTTAFFRVIRKLPFFLIEKCSTKNLYKRNDFVQYIKAFTEASSALFSALGEKSSRLENFIEFIVIYFPKEK